MSRRGMPYRPGRSNEGAVSKRNPRGKQGCRSAEIADQGSAPQRREGHEDIFDPRAEGASNSVAPKKRIERLTTKDTKDTKFGNHHAYSKNLDF
jgi:hypothetical protein